MTRFAIVNTQSVSAQFLLEGAVYALEQAGLLLHDAHLLYKNQRYGSAIVMALYSREEIGRYHLIRQLRRKMIETGNAVTVDDINEACDDHKKKQELGDFGSIRVFSPGEQRHDLAIKRIYNDSQSLEYQDADKRLRAIIKREEGKLPGKRHQLRLKALYVEPSDSEGTWNLPRNKTKDEAYKEIRGASDAYSTTLDRFTRGDDYHHEDPTFYNDLRGWTNCPLMPNLLGSLLSM